MKNINEYSKPADECAADELSRRFRTVDGAKVNGHRNGETDKRFTKRGAFVKLGTKALVELAQVSEPTTDTEIGNLVLNTNEFAIVWENDIPTLVKI